MSLIDDALRRAQAAQQAGPSGPALRIPLPLPDAGRRRGRRIVLMTGAALAIALVLGSALVLRRGSRSPGGGDTPGSTSPVLPASRAVVPPPRATDAPPSSPAAGSRPADAVATPLPEDAAPQEEPAHALAPTAPPAALSGRRGAPPTAVPTAAAAPRDLGIVPSARTKTVRREPPESPQILPPVAVENASASPRIAGDERPRPPVTPREPSRTRTFAGTATVGNAKLELGGIVFSDSHPTALINGRVVEPGSFVDGYTVVKIEPNRVELTDEHERIVLTLK